MEDISVRAITIGVGVLLAIITMSAVMTYYNTAKEAVRDIGSGTDISGLYEKSIEDTLLKGKVTGTEVKNILNYFYDRTDVNINGNNIRIYENNSSDAPTFITITGNLKASTNYTRIKSFILENDEYRVDTNVSSGITTITITKI